MPRGKHGNHRRGSQHPQWSERIRSSHGYTKVRVGRSHPLGDPNGYAYEHLLVWVAAGNARPGPNQILHHRNEDKQDNRLSNLELLSRTDHAREHNPMLPDEAVRAIRERYARGEDGTTLAAEFGIPYQRVYRYIRGETRRRAGGPIQQGNLRKPAAGRLLDGRTWDEYPEVPA
jgi:hypothetical protein